MYYILLYIYIYIMSIINYNDAAYKDPIRSLLNVLPHQRKPTNLTIHKKSDVISIFLNHNHNDSLLIDDYFKYT